MTIKTVPTIKHIIRLGTGGDWAVLDELELDTFDVIDVSEYTSPIFNCYQGVTMKTFKLGGTLKRYYDIEVTDTDAG